MTIQFFGYDKCSTCRKAKGALRRRGVRFEDVDITTHPPSKTQLAAVLRAGRYSATDLLNRSGQVYRELNMKERVTRLSESALLDLLAANGRLIKRPVVTDGARHTVGFDEELFRATWR